MRDILELAPPTLSPMGEGFIDYLSMTKSAGPLYPWDYDEPGRGLSDALEWVGLTPDAASWAFGMGWTTESGKHGYKRAYLLQDGGVQVQVGHNSGRIQVVLSGRGCEMLNDLSDLYQRDQWANIWAQGDAIKVTRIDLARDFATDVTPLDLVEHITPGRGRTSGYISSPTGQTMTYGSRQSEKYLRVYRYSEPHPRHKTLRFEWEIKGDKATQAYNFIRQGQTVDGILAGLALDFGVSSGLWGDNLMIGDSIRLKHEPKERAGKTRWLYKVCVPALRSALWEGTITRAELVQALQLDSLED